MSVQFMHGKKKTRGELRLPQLHFVACDNWMKELGKDAFCAWLEFYSWADRSQMNRETDIIPNSINAVAKRLGVSKTTLYNKIIRPLWNYGFIDLQDIVIESNFKDNPVNIIVYEYPQNNSDLATKEIVPIRDYDLDYKPKKRAEKSKLAKSKKPSPKNGLEEPSPKNGLEPSPKNGLEPSPKNGLNNVLNNNVLNNNDGGRMGEDAKPSSQSPEKYNWNLFKSFCKENEINGSQAMDLFKVWCTHYGQAPFSIVRATLQEMLHDKIKLTKNGWTEVEYKNFVGLFHHRMKTWKQMAVAYEDLDNNGGWS